MKPKLEFSPWAALVAGLLIYFSEGKTLLLLALPVLAHELGHLLFLRLFSLRLTSLCVEPCGLCVEYAGEAAKWRHALLALGGPLFGLLYALGAASFGENGALSAGFSLLLTLFNLVPALPLDGGRIAAALLPEKTAAALGLAAAFSLLCAGLWLHLQGRGAALALAGAALLFSTGKNFYTLYNAAAAL